MPAMMGVPDDQQQYGSGYVPPGGASNMYSSSNWDQIPAELLQPVPAQGYFGAPPAMMRPNGGPSSMMPATTVPGIPGGGFWTAQERALQNGAPAEGSAPGIGNMQLSGRAPNWTGLQNGKESMLPSTDNWRLLPNGFNNPRFMMRNGHIIDKGLFPLLGTYVSTRGGGDVDYGRGGMDFPASSGRFQADWGLFWPGQIEPWEYSQGMKG